MRILHFSDFHINPPGKIELSRRNFRNFLESVKEVNNEKTIDLIIFSGDMIDKGGIDYPTINEAFNRFKVEVIDILLSELNLPRSRFAFVSGNHDVNRTCVTQDKNDELAKTLNSDEALSDYMDEQYLNCTIKRTAEFKKFQKEFYEDSPEYHHSAFESTLLLEIDSRLVGITCLDTSWRCFSDCDQGNILMGRKQLILAEDHIKDSDLKIAVAHHDYSWMVPFEQGAIGKILSGSYKMYLFGHNHGYDGMIREYEDANKVVFITAPGLLYTNTNNRDPQYRNGFMILDYDFVAQSLDVYRYSQGIDDKFTKDISYNNGNGVWHKGMFPYHGIKPIKNFLIEFKKEIRSSWIQASVLNELKGKIKNPKGSSLQIIALSGLGKTRLIYEAFNDERPRKDVYYCNYDDSIVTVVEEFLYDNKERECMLVIDNCPYDKLDRFITKRNRLDCKVRIIGLTNLYYSQESIDYCEQISISPEQLKDSVYDYIDSYIPGTNNYSEIIEIKKMSEGFPAMAIRLVETFRENGTYDMHSLDALLPKILKLDSETSEEELKVLCSLSLFQPVPVGNKEAFDFIINNDCITSLPGYSDISKRRLFNRVIRKFDKSIIENTGTWLNVRPYPLAVMLLSGWLNDMDPDTINQLVQEIDQYKSSSLSTYNTLKNGICERIKYMQDSPQAKDIFDQLLKGPFHSEKVVCSDMGSRLFLAISYVNPVAVASCLFSLFKDKDKEWLSNNISGDVRRNLMWALEKLCFDRDSYKDGVRVLARLAIAENEEYANNATSQIKQLFHLRLPGTQANLEERFDTIKYFRSLGGEYIALTIGIINSAFQNGDFVRTGGAERFGAVVKKEYVPTSNAEILDYWIKCRDLLLEWLGDDPSIALRADVIVEKNCFSWCNDGLIDYMSPLIEKIAEIKNDNWTVLYESLVRNIKYFSKKMSHQSTSTINKWIDQLKPKDFVTKLLMVRYQRDIDYKKSDDEIKRIQNALFQPLANEFFDSELYGDYYVMHDLCVNPDFFDSYFCTVIYERATDQQTETLFNTLLEVIVKEKGLNLKVFFFCICSMFRNSPFFLDFVQEILKAGYKDLYVQILASCEFDQLTSFNRLLQDYNNRDLQADYICIYLRNIRFCTNEMMKQIIESVSEIFPNQSRELFGFVLRFRIFADIREDPELLSLYKKLILSYKIDANYGKDNYEFARFTSDLLEKENDPEFARRLSNKIIEVMKKDFLYGNLEGIYRVLLEKYGSVVWVDFSKALVSDDYIGFLLQVTNEIGSGLGFGSGPMFRMGDDVIKQFCRDYPTKAPMLVANLCPVFEYEKLDDGSVKTERFSDIALWLFDEFGYDEKVLNEFHSNLGSFSWTGSTIPYYESNIECFKQLLTHSRTQVRVWAEKCIKDEEQMLTIEIDREDYMRLHYN